MAHKKKSKVILGSRGSELALCQANSLAKQLERYNKNYRFEVKIIRTKGDDQQISNVQSLNSTGIFTKELEVALLKKEIDVAVHSLKDVPTKLAKGTCIAAYSKRENPRDMLISKRGFTLTTLPQGSRVGTSSIRRICQLRISRSDVKALPLRGNVNTRIQKMLSGAYDAIILASAGINRLKRKGRMYKGLRISKFLPAACQGIIGLQVSSDNDSVKKLMSPLNSQKSEVMAISERECLRLLAAGCRTPIGINCQISGRQIKLKAAVYSRINSSNFIEVEVFGSTKQPLEVARKSVKALKSKGALSILNETK